MNITELIKALNAIKEDSWDCKIKIEYDNWGTVDISDMEVQRTDNINYLMIK